LNNLRNLFRQKVIIDGYDQYKTVVFSLMSALINITFGILILAFANPYIVRFGFMIALLPFLVSLTQVLSAWLAWRGRVRIAFDLVLGIFTLELVIYALTTVGFGLFLAVTFFTVLSTMVVEIAPQSRVNRTLLMAGIFSTLIYLLDFYGPANRYSAAGGLQYSLPFILVFEVIIYLVLLVRQYPRLNLVTKLIVPIVIILYVSIGLIATFNYYTNVYSLDFVNRNVLGENSSQTRQLLINLFETQTRSNALFSVLILILVTLATFGTIRLITNPIRALTLVAQKVTTGKLNVHVDVSSSDEIGTLAQSINHITSQLRQLSSNLEQRVDERSRELTLTAQQALNRTSDLEFVLHFIQDIASVHQLERLLPLIVQLIRDHSNYYHVGIFLLDLKQEFFILRAASSEGGRQMTDRGYRVEINSDSLIGLVAKKGEPLVAVDTGSEAVIFDNPDLPLTRSEVALPLKNKDSLIGILDVHSIQPLAFSQDEISLLSILATHVAIAIEKAKLFDDTLNSLAEFRSLQEGSVQEEWSRYILERQQVGYEFMHGSVLPMKTQPLQIDAPTWETLEKDGFKVVNSTTPDTTPIGQNKPKASLPLMALPIALRGEIIGFIQLEEIDPGRTWTEDEVSLVKSVADQVGLALENARLLEQTRRRAERESLVAKISSRLRASNDPEEILNTAVLELRQALRARTAHIVLPDPSLYDKQKTESSGLDDETASTSG